MPCTPSQVEANRINAQLSTGPKTFEGKERSKFNALKHGLNARSLVIPGEDAAEAQAYLDGIVAALAPRDEFEADLCARMAKLSWKLIRAERVEQTVIRSLMERAELDDKKRREVEIHNLLTADPEFARNVRSQLEETAEGCRWMIETLTELDAAVVARNWRTEYDRRLDLICGSPTLFRLAESRAVILARCITPGSVCLWPPEEEPAIQARLADVIPEFRHRMREETHRSRIPTWEAELRQILADRIAELEALRDLRLSQTATERQTLADLTPYAGDASLERVRKAIRSTQSEQNRLRKALTAHRAEVEAAGSFPQTADAPSSPNPWLGSCPQDPGTTTPAIPSPTSEAPSDPSPTSQTPANQGDAPANVDEPRTSEQARSHHVAADHQEVGGDIHAVPSLNAGTETPGD